MTDNRKNTAKIPDEYVQDFQRISEKTGKDFYEMTCEAFMLYTLVYSSLHSSEIKNIKISLAKDGVEIILEEISRRKKE
jgi:hypothetical protein